MKDFFFLLVGIAIIAGSFYFFLQKPAPPKYQPMGDTAILRVGDKTIKVEIADTPEEREAGLSGRATLPEGEGMLFIFEEPGQYGFWMKDMNFPIDIIWIDDELRIVGIEKNISQHTFPKTFYPPKATKYVLEVNSGFSEKLDIDNGQLVSF